MVRQNRDISKRFHDVMQTRTQTLAETPPRPSASPQTPIQSGPRRRAFAQPVQEQQLKQQYKTIQRGFVTLENLYQKKKAQVQSLQQELQDHSLEFVSTTTALVDQLDEREKVIEHLSAKIEEKDREATVLSAELTTARDHVRGARTMAIEETKKSLLEECAEFLKCVFCSGLLIVPFSLDCRHAGCYQCVLNGFNANGTSCPKCKTFCDNPPQYDAALENILSFLCNHIGHQHHTAESSAVDPKAFAKLYQLGRASLMAPQAAGPHVQVFTAASQSTGPQGRTQAQVRRFDSPKEVGPVGAAKVTEEGGGGISTPMEVES